MEEHRRVRNPGASLPCTWPCASDSQQALDTPSTDLHVSKRGLRRKMMCMAHLLDRKINLLLGPFGIIGKQNFDLLSPTGSCPHACKTMPCCGFPCRSPPQRGIKHNLSVLLTVHMLKRKAVATASCILVINMQIEQPPALRVSHIIVLHMQVAVELSYKVGCGQCHEMSSKKERRAWEGITHTLRTGLAGC